jgi:hypothetical protein
MDVPLPPHHPVPQSAILTPVPTMKPVPFLEQSFGDVVTECIVELTKRRPKAPGRAMGRSINEYIAAYIRTDVPEVGTTT